MIAFQTEYRGHVKFNWSYNPSKDDRPDRAAVMDNPLVPFGGADHRR